ncbi:MAG TPA: hypothetical protein VFE50_13970 [Cyclobacteriaceae bacterium]|nr:hypothetical protein [Cyclobacteriaceae bacterium]
MKLKIATRKAGNGNVRLLLSYHCQARQVFAGVIIPSQDPREGYLEKPVAKTNPMADHFNEKIMLLYHEVQQIISTLRREDKVPSAHVVFQIYRDKKHIDSNQRAQKICRTFSGIPEQEEFYRGNS